MDRDHFDQIAKALSAAGTRRGLLRLGAVLPPAGLLAALLGEAGEAGRRQRRKARHHPGDKKDKRKGRRKDNDQGGLGSGPCLPGTADLQGAIDAASPGATITLCGGIFHTNASISKDLTLIGAGAGQTVLIDGASDPVLAIRSDANVTVQDLSIAKGDDDHFWGIDNRGTQRLAGVTIGGGGDTWHGSGIYNEGTLTLGAGSHVTNNRSFYAGGGIYNSEGAVTLEAESSVTDNVAVYGGGIYNYFGTVLLKAGSNVTDNQAGGTEDGGGIYNDRGTVTVEASGSVTDNDPNNCSPLNSIANCLG